MKHLRNFVLAGLCLLIFFAWPAYDLFSGGGRKLLTNNSGNFVFILVAVTAFLVSALIGLGVYGYLSKNKKENVLRVFSRWLSDPTYNIPEELPGIFKLIGMVAGLMLAVIMVVLIFIGTYL